MTAVAEDRFEDILFTVERMTVEEAQELKQKIAERMGITFPQKIETSAPVVVEEEKQTHFKIVLVDCGSNKMNVLKVVREIFGYALLDAKKACEDLPHEFEGGAREAGKAEEIRIKLSAVGATVKLV